MNDIYLCENILIYYDNIVSEFKLNLISALALIKAVVSKRREVRAEFVIVCSKF